MTGKLPPLAPSTGPSTRGWAGFGPRRAPILMGIVNVTPDSFSDGGRYYDARAAIAQGQRLAQEGAEILDVGGESTRPGATPVPLQEEIRRVVPVIEALAAEGLRVSVDTRHAAVMEAALAAGASIINDVSALSGSGSLAVAAQSKAAICLMHKQGEPHDMQLNPLYEDPLSEVADYLLERAAVCQSAGIAPERICLDPGIGFGKTTAHNLMLLGQLSRLTALGYPLLLGASRKRFIAALAADESPATARLGGSLAAAIWGASYGVAVLRVHDVAATRQALRVWHAISQTEAETEIKAEVRMEAGA